MAHVLAEVIRKYHPLGHQKIFELVVPLTEDQWRWRPTPVAHNIAFAVWHAARHDDWWQAAIPGLLPELRTRLGSRDQFWQVNALARRWGLDAKALGWEETGSGMDDAVAAALSLPAKEVLLDYARRVFDAKEHVVEAIADEDLPRTVTVAGKTVSLGEVLLGTLLHDEWTVGYIAALRRAQDVPRATE